MASLRFGKQRIESRINVSWRQYQRNNIMTIARRVASEKTRHHRNNAARCINSSNALRSRLAIDICGNARSAAGANNIAFARVTAARRA